MGGDGLLMRGLGRRASSCKFRVKYERTEGRVQRDP